MLLVCSLLSYYKNIVIYRYSTKLYTMDETDAKKIFEEIQNLKKEHEKLKEENEQLKQLLKENSIIVPSEVVPQYKERKQMLKVANLDEAQTDTVKPINLIREDFSIQEPKLNKNPEFKENNNNKLKLNKNPEIDEFDKIRSMKEVYSKKANLYEDKLKLNMNYEEADFEIDEFVEDFDEADEFDADWDYEEDIDTTPHHKNVEKDVSYNNLELNSIDKNIMLQKAPNPHKYEESANIKPQKHANNERKNMPYNELSEKPEEEREDMSIISFLARSDKRVQILKTLVESDKIPSIISKEIGDSNHHVSKYLKNLKEKGLVVCLNEDDKRFRFYSITPKGKKYLKIMKRKDY